MLKKARKMIKTAIGASLGGKAIRIKKEDAAAKRFYTPDSARLMAEDKIVLNVTDERGQLIWGKDESFHGAIFVLATLIRGDRELENYHLFPSMLLRSGVKAKGRVHSADSRTPEYAHNEGLPELLPGQSITDYMDELLFHSIEVISTTPEDIWALDFVKIDKNGKTIDDLPRPITDEWWIKSSTKFYIFGLEELEDDATDADAVDADAATEAAAAAANVER